MVSETKPEIFQKLSKLLRRSNDVFDLEGFEHRKNKQLSENCKENKHAPTEPK